MFSEDPILLPEIVDQIVLVTVHPASEREDEELQRRRHSLRLLGRLDQHRPSLGRFFAPYGGALLVTLRRSHTIGMQSKVHPTYKTKYRVANWPAYNQALVRRGDVTVWLSSDAIAAWTPRRSGRRGGQRRYSDLAIETALTL